MPEVDGQRTILGVCAEVSWVPAAHALMVRCLARPQRHARGLLLREMEATWRPDVRAIQLRNKIPAHFKVDSKFLETLPTHSEWSTRAGRLGTGPSRSTQPIVSRGQPSKNRKSEANPFRFNNMNLLSSNREQANAASTIVPTALARPSCCFFLSRIGHYCAKHRFAIDGITQKSENPITQSGRGDPERIERLLKKRRDVIRSGVFGSRWERE